MTNEACLCLLLRHVKPLPYTERRRETTFAASALTVQTGIRRIVFFYPLHSEDVVHCFVVFRHLRPPFCALVAFSINSCLLTCVCLCVPGCPRLKSMAG